MSCCMHRLTDEREFCCNCGEILTDGHSDMNTCLTSAEWGQRIIETAPFFTLSTFNSFLLHRVERLHREVERLQEDYEDLRDEFLSECIAPDVSPAGGLLTNPLVKA